MKKLALIIEDDPNCVTIYRTILKRHGFETCVASNGEAALELLDSYTPQLIILDMGLPLISGVEVYDYIQQQDHLLHVPVLVVSGYKLQDVPTGVQFFPKPFDLTELNTAIDSVTSTYPNQHVSL